MARQDKAGQKDAILGVLMRARPFGVRIDKLGEEAHVASVPARIMDLRRDGWAIITRTDPATRRGVYTLKGWRGPKSPTVAGVRVVLRKDGTVVVKPYSAAGLDALDPQQQEDLLESVKDALGIVPEEDEEEWE